VRGGFEFTYVARLCCEPNYPIRGPTGYGTQGHCANGAFLPGEEWTGGPDFGDPELNCCVCGTAGAAPACVDTPNWQNAYTATCALYESEGHCADGEFIAGHEYTSSEEFGLPREHCCVCGKGGARGSVGAAAGPVGAAGASSSDSPQAPAPADGCVDSLDWSNVFVAT